MPKRKKKKDYLPPCGICQIYEEIPSKHRLANSRFCSAENGKKIEIEYDSPSCSKFNISKIFWCEKTSQRVYKHSCFHRHINQSENNEYCGCKRCPIGILIKEQLPVSQLTPRKGRKYHGIIL